MDLLQLLDLVARISKRQTTPKLIHTFIIRPVIFKLTTLNLTNTIIALSTQLAVYIEWMEVTVIWATHVAIWCTLYGVNVQAGLVLAQ